MPVTYKIVEANLTLQKRVIDLHRVKSTDVKQLANEIAAARGRLVTVGDHWAEGETGEAVLSALGQAGVAPANSHSLRYGRWRTPASLMNSLTPSAFRRDILFSPRAEFHNKPRGAPRRPGMRQVGLVAPRRTRRMEEVNLGN